MTEERKQDLVREWDLANDMDDSDYWEWYEGLTSEEQLCINAWDQQYVKGIARLCSDILARQ